jgi:Ser/Thr protein kinase RdoA (MazF antagonist)
LINHTWKVTFERRNFILQRINQNVFRKPPEIAQNIKRVAAYLKEKHPDYFFVVPVSTKKREELVFHPEKGYFRLLPFVEGSCTYDVATTPNQAFEAAQQFGRFTRMLSGFDATQLHATIPNFHDLSLRYRQFKEALQNGNKTRIREAEECIHSIESQKAIVNTYEQINADPLFKKRVTHHDTKISNVLFNEKGEGMCVIDLDTVMPGYFISDVGDMMRTYLSPVSEEEKDLSKIIVRKEFLTTIMKGYMSEMGDELTEVEKEHFLYTGKFMIYMQAIRFLADHINDDIYYGAKYEGHNLVRAQNQLALLKSLLHLEKP